MNENGKQTNNNNNSLELICIALRTTASQCVVEVHFISGREVISDSTLTPDHSLPYDVDQLTQPNPNPYMSLLCDVLSVTSPKP